MSREVTVASNVFEVFTPVTFTVWLPTGMDLNNAGVISPVSRLSIDTFPPFRDTVYIEESGLVFIKIKVNWTVMERGTEYMGQDR